MVNGILRTSSQPVFIFSHFWASALAANPPADWQPTLHGQTCLLPWVGNMPIYSFSASCRLRSSVVLCLPGKGNTVTAGAVSLVAPGEDRSPDTGIVPAKSLLM
ncbi:hypothetical protein Y1Q_0011061 [Alligator mississippiensis]|uniref:Uncharacterized protein n=1 Tax=Alligator mississippiensis TaxID=8496 RepID=A0A151NWD4_ALLMI|nr:hypothetical protein Y1Q_0011061 [Alligator mississippiensis]